jgi:tetratricopeptide (TPR) repeat protein
MMKFSLTVSVKTLTVFGITIAVLVWPPAVYAKDPKMIQRRSGGMSLTPASPAQSLIRRGEYFREHGEIDKALAHFNQAINADPKATAAYIGRARVWEEFGKVDKALGDFTTALKTDPDNLIAGRFRGDLYQSMHRFQDAINDYSKVIALAPTDGLFYSRGICNLKMSKPALAVKDFDMVIKVQGKRARTLEKRADALLMLKQYEKALDDYNMAMKLDPDGNDSKDSYEHLHKSKAEIYKRLGKLDLAKKEIGAASAGKYKLMDLAPFASDSMK